MRISEIIRQLSTIRAFNGDLEVKRSNNCMSYGHESCEIDEAEIVLALGDNKPSYVELS